MDRSQRNLKLIDRTWVRRLLTKLGVKVGKRTCCRKIANLVLMDNHPDVAGKKDLSVRVCKICKARHFELVVDPGQFQMTLKPVG